MSAVRIHHSQRGWNHLPQATQGVQDGVSVLRRLDPAGQPTGQRRVAGRLLTDVSFITASGLVLRIAIRRRGQAPLAFFDRPEWLLAWFPGYADEVLTLCHDRNALLEPNSNLPLPTGERAG